MSDRARKQFEREYRKEERQKKGDVSIDYQPPASKKIDKDAGDYIPYEEMNE